MTPSRPVGQRSQAERGKSNEGQACRDRAPQRPGECDPIGAGREVTSEMPEGLPHVASRNGNTGLPARAIVAGRETWARVSRSYSAVPAMDDPRHSGSVAKLLQTVWKLDFSSDPRCASEWFMAAPRGSVADARSRRAPRRLTPPVLW